MKSPGKDLISLWNGNNRPLCVVVYEGRIGWEEMTWRGGQKTVMESFG